MGGRGASSASAKLGKQAKSGSMPSKTDMAISAAAAGRAPDNLSDFTNNSNDMRRVSRALQANGLYSPWLQDKLTDAEIQNAIAKWKGSSSYVRKNVQYRDDKTSRHSQGFDDWLNSGSYGKNLYREVAETDAKFAKLQQLKPGDHVGQNGPASFSKTVAVARNFADNGYSPGSNRVVYVMHGGTRCGRDISKVHGYGSEQEVSVGSASRMVVTKIEMKTVGGKHYLFVHGREEKVQYVLHTTH